LITCGSGKAQRKATHCTLECSDVRVSWPSVKATRLAVPFTRYNYTGEEFFVKKKDRGFRHVTSTAKLIIREALPIQCVEAVFVGAYLTASMNEVVAKYM